jgi:hypothetical protein
MLPLLFLATIISSSLLNQATQHPEFTWHPERKLNNRQCVLNLFVDKQKPDEFNPDWVEIKPGETDANGALKRPSPPQMEPGTYRSKGQVKVLSRFIGSVADSFRPNMDVQHHLLFTGSRDGGHMAELASKYWPIKGKYRTQVHVLADDNSLNTNDSLPSKSTSLKNPEDVENAVLDYGPLGQIEQRFQNHANAKNVHIYDSRGRVAGIIPSDIDDDDVYESRQEEMFGTPEDNEYANDLTRTLSVNDITDDSVISNGGTDYISLKKKINGTALGTEQ